MNHYNRQAIIYHSQMGTRFAIHCESLRVGYLVDNQQNIMAALSSCRGVTLNLS